MKILFTTDGFPLPHMPGVPRHFQTAKWFADNGHDVTVLCNARNYLTDEPAFSGSIEAPELHQGMRVIALPTPSGLRKSKLHKLRVYVALLWQAWRVGRRLPAQDFVIAGTPPLFMPLASLLLARRWGVPSILEVRDLHPQMSIASGIVPDSWMTWPWHAFERGLRKSFDHVVAAVPRMSQMIAAEGNPTERITVITSGYDLDSDEDTDLPADIDAYFRENTGKFIVAYTGNMGRGAWNTRGLVEVAAELRDRPDIAFLFIGDGEQKEQARADAAAAGLANTAFFSSIGRLQVAKVMRMTGALVMAYRDSRFYEYILPIKLFDYMGAARPVVFSGVGDGPALLREAEGGIVLDSFDAPAFAKAIRTLADDPEMAERYGRNNRRFVLEHLLRERQMQKWDDAIVRAFAARARKIRPPEATGAPLARPARRT